MFEPDGILSNYDSTPEHFHLINSENDDSNVPFIPVYTDSL